MKKFLSVVLTIAMIIGTIGIVASAAEVEVTDNATLTEALKSATKGDVITLGEGTFKPFTVPETADGVTIKGTVVDGEKKTTIETLIKNGVGGVVVHAENVVLEDLYFTAADREIYAYTASVSQGNYDYLTIRNCEFHGNGNSLAAVYCARQNVLVENCVIDGYERAINCFQTGNGAVVTVKGTKIVNSVRAIHVQSVAADLAGAHLMVDDCAIEAQYVSLVTGSDNYIKNSDVDAQLEVHGNVVITNTNLNDSVVSVNNKGTAALENNTGNYNVEYNKGATEESGTRLVAAKVEGEYFVSLQDAVDVGGNVEIINDIILQENVVITKDITINGNGHSVKGADYPQVAEWDDAGVTPIKVDGATVTLKNITVEGGATANNAEFANLNSYGIAGDGIVAVNGAVVNIIDSTVKGGASDAEYTRGAGSAIVTTESTVQATNSVLESGALNTPNTIGEAVIETDEASVIVLKDVTLNAPKSGFANANVIEIYNGEDTAYDVVKEVTMSGVIYIPGARLKKVNIVTPEGEILILKGNIDSNMIAEEVEVVFEKVDQDVADEEQSDLYNIVLKSTQDMVYKNEDTGELISLNRKRFINRLNSLDLTFGLDHDADDIDYEIIESNEDIRINNVNNLKDRFEFHYKDKDGAYDTADTIILGQVKVSGYGEYEFFVDTNANSTNVAHATTSSDNIVNTFLPYGDITAGEGKLKIDESTTGVIRNVVPTKNLTIHVDFPNAVNDNVIAYQDMKVTVSGEDMDDIVIDLGEDAVETSIATANRGNAKYEAKFVDGAYVVNVTDALTINTSYDITVEGAGYRTARYTVRMTDNKTINFWNNVKDADADMEAGKFQAKKNFLAGDIVKDNNINVYDLSAVVSYFGETGLSENNHPEYAKYDLNRDGFIDSKDVAMVLVSWAE